MPVRHPARACRATRSSRKGTNSQASLTRRPRTARLHEARRCIRKLEIENAFLKKCRSLLCWSVHGPLSPQSRRSPSGFVRHVFCSSLLTRKRLSGHDCSLLENHLVLQGRVREVGCALVFSTENARDERAKAVLSRFPLVTNR